MILPKLKRNLLEVTSKIKHHTRLILSHIYVRSQFKKVHGPKRFILKKDEVALILVGKNVEYYLKDFYKYHKEIGVSYFIFIDNGSTDKSIEIATGFENTIVAKCKANFKKNQNLIRYYSTKLYCENGWRLCLDADELLDYPNSNIIKINKLTSKLSARGYNAIVAQMLDMIPTIKNSNSYKEDIKTSTNYSTKKIKKTDLNSTDNIILYFCKKNQYKNNDIKIFTGGVRKELFEENCCLTKHPLFKIEKNVIPFPHPHVTIGLKCAKFTVLIKHYKFSNNYIIRDMERSNNNLVSHNESTIRNNIFTIKPNILYEHNYNENTPTIKKLIQKEFLIFEEEAREIFGNEINN